MTFPLSVRFNKPLKTIITSDNKEQILQYIKKRILDDKADNVKVEDIYVSYKGSTSYWNWGLFRSVDSGIFSLLYKDNSWLLNYQINMRELFIGTAILSTLMGIFAEANSGDWWVAIVMFVWLCGANWITNMIRHESLAAGIAFGIDELYCEKELLIGMMNIKNALKVGFKVKTIAGYYQCTHEFFQTTLHPNALDDVTAGSLPDKSASTAFCT